jgi:PTS system nitrogen regulatory IIA component
MYLRDIFRPDSVLLDLQLKSMSHVFEHVSAFASEITGARSATITEALVARHAQGTLISNRVAVPHARVEGLSRVLAFFIRLRTPIITEQNEEVDMLFILLAPKQADGLHLRALAEVARLMRDNDFSSHLRNATTRQEIWNLLTQE